MTMIPEYQDIHVDDEFKRNNLPFLISINTLDLYVKPHHHDFAELSFVFEGSGTETINEDKHVMEPGIASFLPPHHIHEIISDPGAPIRLYCCMFDINMLYGSPYDFELVRQLLRSGSDFPSYVHFDREQTEHLKEIFAEMLHEYNNSEFGKFSFIRTKLIEALLLFSRVQQRIDFTLSATPSNDLKKNTWEILLYLHLHYNEKITLEDLSLRFKVSTSHICHSIKKLCGQSFLDYLHSLRINYALCMLATTDMTITDISVETGFDSFRSFSRVFRKSQGMTPSKYRKSRLDNRPGGA